jgi:DNA-binding transcriptional MerR regulator
MALKVSEVAALAGVTVRTLHHYDEIGLVRPSARSQAGYRLYAPSDIERLQQVLFFRELGFGLDEVQRILSDPDFDVGSALRLQRRLLEERAIRIKALIGAVDAAIDSIEKGTTMTPEETLQVFGDFTPEAVEEEVKQRWGETAEYQESKRRTKSYRKEDWEAIRAEAAGIYSDLARLMAAGVAPTSDPAAQAAERHRARRKSTAASASSMSPTRGSPPASTSSAPACPTTAGRRLPPTPIVTPGSEQAGLRNSGRVRFELTASSATVLAL